MPLDLEQFAAVARTIGLDEHGLKIDPIGGGDIADCYLLEAADSWVFLKTLPLEQAGLLSAEADGLEALSGPGCLRVPRVIRRGMHDGFAWLALEYLPLERRSARCDASLGQQLAELHRVTGESFGWHRSNYLGRTPQVNSSEADWTRFFADHRLGAQFDRLRRGQPDGFWGDLRRQILTAWEDAGAAHRPAPSLIHGDLWRGNAASLPDDIPVIFDPAVHYGDRECDLAMAHLFGGFDDAFYSAYHEAWPLPPGYERRRLFYKLYHMLNHANLFGGTYIEASGQLCRRILDH